MMIPGKLYLEDATTAMRAPLASRSFIYKDKRYWTLEKLAPLLPSWSFPGAIQAFAIPYTLVEHLNQYTSRASATPGTIEEQQRLLQCLLYHLEREKLRVKDLRKSLWVIGRRRQYLTTWLNLINKQLESTGSAVRELNTLALFFSKHKLVPFELTLIPQQQIDIDARTLAIPLGLHSYSPNTGRLWGWWFKKMSYYRFLRSKQTLLHELHLRYEPPKNDAELLRLTKNALIQELNSTQALINQSRFYQFTWRAFLRAWVRMLNAAIQTLAQGEVTWQKRLDKRNESIIKEMNSKVDDDVIGLDLIEPEQYEHWSDDQITANLEKLETIQAKLKVHAEACIDLAEKGYLQTTDGDKLKQTIQAHLNSIITKQQAFHDIRLLAQKKAALGQLPPFTDDIPDINVLKLDIDPFIQQIQRWEEKLNAAKVEQLANERNFYHQKYLQLWHKGLIEYTDNLMDFKFKAICQISDTLHHYKYLEGFSKQKIIAFLTNNVWFTEQVHPAQKEIVDNMLLRLQNNDQLKFDNNCLTNISMEEITRIKELIDILGKGNEYHDTLSMRWLCDCVQSMRHQNSLNKIYNNELLEIEQKLAHALPVAGSICASQLENPGNSQGYPCVDDKYLEEILCYGLLLALGDSSLLLKQHKCLQKYLVQQLQFFAKFDISTNDKMLNTFEQIVLHLAPVYEHKIQALQNYRQTQAWSDYQAYCKEWLALLTYPSVDKLNANNFLSSPASSVEKSNTPTSLATTI